MLKHQAEALKDFTHIHLKALRLNAGWLCFSSACDWPAACLACLSLILLSSTCPLFSSMVVCNSVSYRWREGQRGNETHTVALLVVRVSGERTRLPWRLCARHTDRLATDVRIFADAFIPSLLFMVSLLTLTAERPSDLRNPHSATLPTFPPCSSRPTQKSSLIQDF